MPVLDGVKAELVAHLQTLITQMSLGTTGVKQRAVTVVQVT
tara:strand:- start:374 stop:496 length:123 start_codon:yes stop_codon:yes gene_type:complete